MKKIIFIIVLISGVSPLWIFAQEIEEEVIKIQNEKITDLDVDKSRVERDYGYLTNASAKEEGLFDKGMILGLSDNSVSRLSATESRSGYNYLLLKGGSGYLFLGELDLTQPVGENWFRLRFTGQGNQNLSSLFEGGISNSKKYRFDVDTAYQYVYRPDSGGNYLHTFRAVHTDYSIGLQNWTNAQDVLFFYNFGFGYEGYYLFSKLNLEHSVFWGGGKYSPESYDESGFSEFEYNLKLSGNDRGSGWGGLWGDFTFYWDWLRFPANQEDDRHSFFIGGGIGYDWEINQDWLLQFYLGHLSEITKTSQAVETDSFLPIAVLPKILVSYKMESLRFAWEVGLKSDRGKLREIYGGELFYDNGVLPYLHRLAEARFSMEYEGKFAMEDIKEPLQINLNLFVLYNYFFNYDRGTYTPGELKGLTSEQGVQRIGGGIDFSIKIFKWLSIDNRSMFSYNLEHEFFPPIDSLTDVIFSIPQIYSRFVVGYYLKFNKIISPDGKSSWSLNKQRLDANYGFRYRSFEVLFSVINILNDQNYQEIPDIRESGTALAAGLKYHF